MIHVAQSCGQSSPANALNDTSAMVQKIGQLKSRTQVLSEQDARPRLALGSAHEATTYKAIVHIVWVRKWCARPSGPFLNRSLGPSRRTKIRKLP
jgi:hypothetical protein